MKATSRRCIYVLICLALMMVVCAGCGKKDTKALDSYYDSMNRFATGMTKIKNDLESVDTSVPGAYNEVLDYLDKMKEQFATLAEIEVPDEFSSNEELADEAYEYMSQAVDMFHEYYEDPNCDRAVFEVATENYSRAMKRINYISYILRGELPEGSDYEVIQNNTDFNPITDPNSSDSSDASDSGVPTEGETVLDDDMAGDILE